MVCPNHDDTQICPDCTYQPRCHWCSERCVIIQHAVGHGQSEDCRCDRHARPDHRDSGWEPSRVSSPGTARFRSVSPPDQQVGRTMRGRLVERPSTPPIADTHTFRVEQAPFTPWGSLPPLEQHKADLEMIIAACVTGADKTGEAACIAIAKLANKLLMRLREPEAVSVTCSNCGAPAALTQISCSKCGA